ncbi:hypothetical protein [Aquimarina sp. AU474]|uniref:hypothetical protein n=1 Tax=Aquimarina sp. AU474 TaxID=2108529 RepID=UPI000D686DF3|nr:hypothetical protein [Aquimarina sp. AU474]
MLRSILELQGVELLENEVKKNINGGVTAYGICPSAGDTCCAGGFLLIPCLGPESPIVCVNGVWTEI